MFIFFSLSFLFFFLRFYRQPKVVTATDEAELARQMERAELENAEVAGDDDEEEVEGMEGDFSGGEGTEHSGGGKGVERNEKTAEHNGKNDENDSEEELNII